MHILPETTSKEERLPAPHRFEANAALMPGRFQTCVLLVICRGGLWTQKPSAELSIEVITDQKEGILGGHDSWKGEPCSFKDEH